MRRAVRLLICFILLLAATTAAQAERRVALVIGNSTYTHVPSLANPANDAKLIADTLTALGFTLTGGAAQLDLDKAGLDRAVQAFGREIQGAEVALFYYAGHGVQLRGQNYLIPVGANPTREADADFQMLNAQLVLRQMEGSGSKLNLMILDACRNNPFGGRGLRSTAPGLAQMQAPEGALISFATQPGNVALDGQDGNSPFSKALAETMRKPGLDIFRTFNAVGLAVKQFTGGQQQPWVSSSPISGDFYFAGRPEEARPGAPSAKPDELAALQKRLKELEERLKKQADQPKPKEEPKVAIGVYPEKPKAERSYKPGDEFQDCDACPKMVVAPAGEFLMGAPESEPRSFDTERPQHKVVIPKPFAVGKFEVTVGKFHAFVNESKYSFSPCLDRVKNNNPFQPYIWVEKPDRSFRNPGFRQTVSHPVVCVSWDDAKAYVAWLSKKTGKHYRLLSEAEWEYVARAGTTTPFSTGQTITTDQANFDGNATYNGSPKGRFRGQTVPVGSFPANAFGLHDMHGNVAEWTEDCATFDYSTSARVDGSAWTTDNCTIRRARGGHWENSPVAVRSAWRGTGPGFKHRSVFYGFRVARTLD